MSQWLVVSGNVFDGLELIGPFATALEAVEYGSKNIREQYVVHHIIKPHVAIN